MGKFTEPSGFRSFGEWGIGAVNDLMIVHTYPSPYFPLSLKVVDRHSTYYPGYEIRISRIAGRPVQFQEFGLSKWHLAAMTKAQRKFRLAGYYRNSMWGALTAGADAGVLAWCFTDYSLELFLQEPYISHPYELFFGVVNRNYQPNPSGKELAAFAQILNELDMQNLKTFTDPLAILLPENYNDYPTGQAAREDTNRNQNKALFTAYLVCRQIGINPEFVHPAQSLHSFRIVILPNLQRLSPDLAHRLRDFQDQGGMVYASWSNVHLPALQKMVQENRMSKQDADSSPELQAARTADQKILFELRNNKNKDKLVPV